MERMRAPVRGLAIAERNQRAHKVFPMPVNQFSSAITSFSFHLGSTRVGAALNCQQIKAESTALSTS